MSSSSFDELLDRSNLTGRQFLIYAGQRLHPGVVLYNAVYVIRWPGLAPERFNDAWQALVNTCDALRTVVEEIEGVPQQRVLPPFPAPVERVDIGESADLDSAIAKWVDERLLQRPLALSERIYDTALLRTSATDHVWFLHIHHIILDGAGRQILIRRLTELYTGDVRSTAEPPQFADHAMAACRLRQSPEYLAARTYWQNFLRCVPETPHFYGVDAFRTTAQERVVLSLDRSVSTAIRLLAGSLADKSVSEHAAAANLFNGILAAYLSRVSATDEVSIGVTYHNRRTEADRLTIGLFMEVFPISLRVRSDATLRSIMQQVAIATAVALKHRHYSVGHSARNPAFSGLFNYALTRTKPLGPLDVRLVHPGHGSNAISLTVEPREDTFDLWFDVNADVAATSSAPRLAEHLRTLLVAAVQAPDSPLSQLPILPPAEAREVLAACAGPRQQIAASDPVAVHGWFERMAASRPAAHALVFGNLQLTYRELNEAANVLARRLRGLGVKRGKRVGVCLERSPEMVIAVIAVLKTGGAYVPLEPSHPPARLAAMLVDAEPSVLITARAIAATLPTHASRLLCIEEAARLPGESDDNLGIPISPEDIAYVIYTSGSTGIPKGVLVAHGNVTNHLKWRSSFFPVGPADRSLQTASLSFDDSVWEMFEPLSVGACLVLTRPRFEYDSAYLVSLMIQQQVTIACFVPSLLRMVIEDPAILDCKSLRRLTTGGEGLSLALQKRVAERLPEVAFYNGYGTTETTIASLYWKCVAIAGRTSVPIGRPIANTEVYVLDANRQLVPPAVTGEIWIGGAGVARGYLNRPALTAAAFANDPFSNRPGAQLYRTGDIGRLHADGVFEFGGRVDDQVKIRGVRVELGDIESALCEHPGIRAAAVVCDSAPAGARLTAFVVPRSGNVTPAELRAFVRDRIPAALIPNQFESIAALPLTSSGKLDRRSLPARSVAEEQSNYAAPRNELEMRLIRLWEAALHARPIGVRDDFFTLGGHSLLAVQLAASIGRAVGRSLSPGLLFEAPTIEMLSSLLSTARANHGILVQLADGEPGAPLFLIHHVSGDITSYRDLARYLGSRRAIYGVRAPELDSNGTPLDRVEAMAARYVGEIRALRPHGPYLIGGHSAGAHIAFEVAQQLRAAGERVSLLAILEADARTRNGNRRSLLDLVRYQLDSVNNLPPRQRGVYLWRRFASWVERTRASPALDQQSADPQKNAVWIAIERAVREYRPQPYPGSITLFRATDRRATGTYTRTLGWGRLARGGIRVIDVPGTHSTVLRPGSEPPMAAKLRACLDELTAAEQTARRLP